jgi:hypothetical protein
MQPSTGDEIESKGQWPDEAWSRQPIEDAAQAAYYIGRLLNCFTFHAQQAWLLCFCSRVGSVETPQHRLAVQQYRLAAGAIQRVLPHVGRLRFRPDCEAAQRIIETKARAWHELKLSEQDYEDFDNTIHLSYESRPLDDRREESCREMFQYREELGAVDALQHLLENVEKSHAVLLELGDALDRLARPRDAYRYLWDNSKQPDLLPGESLRDGTDCQWVDYEYEDEDGGRVGGSRKINCLANCHRSPWECPPDVEWRFALPDILNRAKLPLAIERATKITRSPSEAESIRSLAEELHSLIWADLNSELPRWNLQRRQLLVRGHVVKDFKRQRPGAQEAVLDAFQKAGWPRSIDNPLPAKGDRSEQDILAQTVRDLNQNQRVKLLVFSVENSGTQASWQPLASPTAL